MQPAHHRVRLKRITFAAILAAQVDHQPREKYPEEINHYLRKIDVFVDHRFSFPTIL